MIATLLALQFYAAPVAVLDLNVAAWQAMLEWSSARKRVRKRDRLKPKQPPALPPGEVSPRRVVTVTIPICEIVHTFEELWLCRAKP